METAEVWGYRGVTPGPTAIAYEGERVHFAVMNDLPEPTTIHFHGGHEPNDADGVGGVSQPQPIPPGGMYTYEFTPGHAGTIAYHTHTNSARQELRGLDGFSRALPRQEPDSHHVDRDFARRPVVVLQGTRTAGRALPARRRFLLPHDERQDARRRLPHHTSNDMKEGPNGSPLGMARVINVTQ
ncbi:MAG TPA: multicopper oxidase domain-containing protein [Gemmatimonadaceae bacterium]